MQWPRHPALWDPVCFTDQWTQSLLISSVPLTETGSTHSSHTHIQTNSSYTLTPHTHTNSSLTPHIHTLSHTLHTHIPSHTLTHSSHTLTHASQSHTHTLHTHTTSHTPHSPTHTHTHTHSSPSHKHTQTQTQSLQEHTHRKHGDPVAVLTHQACGACGNSPESQLRSVAGASTHWESLGPRSSLREWRGLRLTQLSPEQTSLLCKICHN